MHYLKPELLARCRSQDDAVSEAASAEWEQALAAYNAELDSIRPSLPAGVRSLLAHCSLHDAKILSIALTRRIPRLTLLIQLEGRSRRPGKLLELQYLLARTSGHAAFSLSRQGAPGKRSPDEGRIQYDEFGKVTDNPIDLFSHSLLLRGDIELQIWFTEMRVRPLQRVIVPSMEDLGLALT